MPFDATPNPNESQTKQIILAFAGALAGCLFLLIPFCLYFCDKEKFKTCCKLFFDQNREESNHLGEQQNHTREEPNNTTQPYGTIN